MKYQTNGRYITKKRDKRLQQQKDEYVHFEDLVRTYVEFEIRKQIRNIGREGS